MFWVFENLGSLRYKELAEALDKEPQSLALFSGYIFSLHPMKCIHIHDKNLNILYILINAPSLINAPYQFLFF